MSREELVERFSLDRVGTSPATFDYAKLDWMNGVYLRAMEVRAYGDALVEYLREQGYAWDEQRVRAAVPLVQEKIARLGEFPAFAGFLFEPVGPDARVAGEERTIVAEARGRLAEVDPFEPAAIEAELRAASESLGLKPREAFQPVRIAVTGSNVSPGLFESIALLGREETLARLDAALTAAAA